MPEQDVVRVVALERERVDVAGAEPGPNGLAGPGPSGVQGDHRDADGSDQTDGSSQR